MSTSTDQVSVPPTRHRARAAATACSRPRRCWLLAVIAIAFPKVYSNPAVTNYGVLALIYVTVASAWNIFSGNTGYISLGQAVFYGSGAYALGIAASRLALRRGRRHSPCCPLAAVVGAIIAVPFGLIALRVRRHTFIVITIAVFFIFQLMAFNLSFTRGTSGLNAPFLTWPASGYNTPFYYIALAIAAGTIAIAWLIRRSRFGLQLRAIRDDEDRARGLGVKTMRVKLSRVRHLRRDHRDDRRRSGSTTSARCSRRHGFDPLFDLTLVLMAFLGGYGSIAGTVLGALIVEPLTLWLNTQPQFTGGVPERDPARRRLPHRRAVHAARHHPDRRRVDHEAPEPRGGPRSIPATTIGGPATGRRPPRHRLGQLRRCPVTALLRTDGIKKAYGGVQALNGASIAVDEGTVAGLIGPNGSGKTTLFNVITGYAAAGRGPGLVRRHGDHQRSRPTRCSRPGIGRTFQLTRIFPRLTVIENMLIAAQARDKPKNLLSWFGRDAWTHHRRHATGTARVRRHRAARRPCSRARSPTGSASCWSSPTCWSPTRRSSCSTSRPAG